MIRVIRVFGIFDKGNQTHQAGSVYDVNGLAPCLDTSGGGYRMPLIIESDHEENEEERRN